MEKNKGSIPATIQGRLLKAEDGTQYFVCGKSRIRVSEHFAAEGKPLGDLIADVIQHTAYHMAS